MRLFIIIAYWAMLPPILAQNYLATNAANSEELPTEPSSIQDYYQQLLQKYGINERYRLSELALQKFACNKEEYSSKLYILLAEEALMMRSFDQATTYYQLVLTTAFEPSPYTGGLIAEQAKMQALTGLRTIAIEQANYAAALKFHEQYMDSLKLNWKELLQQNRLTNDKIEATCYQLMGESEKAIACLSPYAFGIAGEFYGEIDKTAIDYLTNLLRTKYPKKDYKRLLGTLGKQIYAEQKDGRVLFYLQLFENKIYFPNDSANFGQRVTSNEYLMGQAIAHYQQKLFNSYFYQSLVAF